MDLHEIYEALQKAGFRQGEVVIGFDPGAGRDATRHHCFCGYSCELVEVMAIHAVRVHNYPLVEPELERRPMVVDRGRATTSTTISLDPPPGRVEFFEADDPSGPWFKCRDGIVRKRYARFVKE